MTVHRRSLAVLLVAATLALSAAGCGVKSTGSPSPTITVDQPTNTTNTTNPTNTTDLPGSRTTETAPDTTPDSTDSTIPGSVQDQIREQMVTGFKTLGLNDKKARCLADAYIKEFGSGATANPDYSKILGLFSNCGIDPAEIGSGGGN